MPVANIAPVARVQVDVVPMAREWLAEWMQKQGMQLAPSAYADLMNDAALAMLGVSHDTAEPIIDKRNLQAAIQQYGTARRQLDDELLMLM
jgi:hypothetical protein